MMKKGLKNLSRKKVSAFLLAGTMLLSACAGTGQSGEESRIALVKDGTVKSYIMETFDQAYYDIEELKTMILTEAASYNRSTGQSSITAEKVEVSEQKAVVEMTYATAGDYEAFNEVVFFAGTPQQAQEAGYDLNVVLSSVKDTNETIGEADILAMKDMILLITDVPEKVELYGKAVYADDHAVLSENQKALLAAEDREEAVYVLFKP